MLISALGKFLAASTAITVTVLPALATETIAEQLKPFVALQPANNSNKSFWQQLPGNAIDVSDGWVIGTEANPVRGGYKIYRWNGTFWQEMPGHAVRIGGTYNNPYVVNNENEIYWWDGFAWQQLPGSAIDVTDGWVIGTEENPAAGGYSIYRWNGTFWQKMPGHAVRIGGNSSNPYVVNNENEIYWWDGFAWQQLPGSATDVTDGWMIGAEENPAEGGYNIYRWSGTAWQEMPGHAVHIGGNSSNPYVVNNENEIYQAQ